MVKSYFSHILTFSNNLLIRYERTHFFGGGVDPFFRLLDFGGLDPGNLNPALQLCLPDSCIVRVAELAQHRWVLKVEKVLVKLRRLCLKNSFFQFIYYSFRYFYVVHNGRFIYYRKSVLHLLDRMFHVRVSRCSTN